DLDHLGAEVGEQTCGERRRDEVSEFEHAHPLEQAAPCADFLVLCSCILSCVSHLRPHLRLYYQYLKMYRHYMNAHNVTDVGVLDKSMAIIATCEATPMMAADIAETLDLSLPTVHRLARALTTHGLLAREPNGAFRMGARFVSFGLGQIARGPLRTLAENTGEACQLWVPRGSNRLCLVSETMPNELHVELREGTQLPLADGGTAARVLNGERTEQGWVLTVSERTQGLTSISAPVVTKDGLVGAVCVVAPVARVPTDLGELFGTRLLVTASTIERALGSA